MCWGGGQCGPPAFAGPVTEGLPPHNTSSPSSSLYGFQTFHPEAYSGWTGPTQASRTLLNTWQGPLLLPATIPGEGPTTAPSLNFSLYALEAYEPDLTHITPDNNPTSPFHNTRVPTYYGTARNLTGRGPLASGWVGGSTWGTAPGVKFQGAGFERRVEGVGETGVEAVSTTLPTPPPPPPPAPPQERREEGGEKQGRLSELEAAAALGSQDEPLTEAEKALQKVWRLKGL